MGWMKKKMLVLPLLCCLFLLSCGADQQGSDSSFQDSAALQPGTYRKISSKEAKETFKGDVLRDFSLVPE